MQWTNDRSGYGWLSIALHWLAALSVFYMLWTGFNAGWVGEAGDREGRRALMTLHVSFGMTVLFLLLVRVVASFAQTRPDLVPQSAPLMTAARVTHMLLLLGILLQILSGPLMIWSMARPIAVWDWFAIPSPFAARNRNLHEAFEIVHLIGRWMLVAAIGLHVLAVVKHTFIDRDGLIRRILVPGGRPAS